MTTMKELQALQFISGYKESNGEAPTIVEIGKYLSIASTASVYMILKRLEHQGKIKRGRRWRQIEIL